MNKAATTSKIEIPVRASNVVGTTGASGLTVTTYTSSGEIRGAPLREANEMSLKQIESAVYSYIRAMRTLGKTRVNTSEMAKALGLKIEEVHKTLGELQKKGVKLT